MSFQFSQSLCTPKFIEILLDENDLGLNQNVHFLFFFVGCAMPDSLKLSN
jgi:hypothetical protein